MVDYIYWNKYSSSNFIIHMTVDNAKTICGCDLLDKKVYRYTSANRKEDYICSRCIKKVSIIHRNIVDICQKIKLLRDIYDYQDAHSLEREIIFLTINTPYWNDVKSKLMSIREG
jgi:hypothetical protein